MRTLTFVAVVGLAYGLWVHDWQTILASLAVAVIWPLIRDDVGSAGELERAWGDDL